MTDRLTDDRTKRNIKLATQALSDAFEQGRSEGRAEALAAHECPTVPEWRPVIDGEDLTGYEVRSRDRDRDVWDAWGVAARRRNDGRWVTEGGWLLNGWPVVETTAPLPEPEPWDDDTLDEWEDALRSTIDLDAGWTTSTRAVLNLLAERGLIERPKAGA